MGLDEITEGDRHLFLDIARLVHMAGHAEELGARIVRTAKARKPLGPAAQDRWRDSNRFDIVHRGRAAIETGIGREWRLQARLAFLAFEAFQKGRFLAADIGPCAMVDIEIEIPAILVVLADQAGLIGFLDGRLQRLAFGDILTAQIDVAGMRAHRIGGHHAAFDQKVRIVTHDLAVLAGARLGLVCIDDKIVRTVTNLFRHEGPFEAGRKACPAPAAKT